MTLKYDDCASCAFQEGKNAVCLSCKDADQWEEFVDEDSEFFENFRTKPISFSKRAKRKLKKSESEDD